MNLRELVLNFKYILYAIIYKFILRTVIEMNATVWCIVETTFLIETYYFLFSFPFCLSFFMEWINNYTYTETMNIQREVTHFETKYIWIFKAIQSTKWEPMTCKLLVNHQHWWSHWSDAPHRSCVEKMSLQNQGYEDYV